MIEHFDKDLFKKCLPHLGKQPVIFDVGAHEGKFTEFVLGILPQAKCYMFEPNIELANKLPYKNVFPMAVSDCNYHLPMYIPPKKNDELSSLYKREVFDETGYEIKQVPCTSIDSFCVGHGVSEIDYLKVDVEGAELDVLNGCNEMMAGRSIKFIQIEYGGTYPDADITFLQIIKVANSLGYNVYELVDKVLNPITTINFIEDYRYAVFLLTYIKC